MNRILLFIGATASVVLLSGCQVVAVRHVPPQVVVVEEHTVHHRVGYPVRHHVPPRVVVVQPPRSEGGGQQHRHNRPQPVQPSLGPGRRPVPDRNDPPGQASKPQRPEPPAHGRQRPEPSAHGRQHPPQPEQQVGDNRPPPRRVMPQPQPEPGSNRPPVAENRPQPEPGRGRSSKPEQGSETERQGKGKGTRGEGRVGE